MITALLSFPSPSLFMLINTFIPLASTIFSTLMVASSSQVPHILSTSNNLVEFYSPAPNPTPDITSDLYVYQKDGEFIINLSFGTPPRLLSAVMDTGSDLIWTQCTPCNPCYHQPTPIFNPNTSSSFSPLPCSNPICAFKMICESNLCKYRILYGDDSFSEGYLAMDTFILGNSASFPYVQNLAFGCGYNNNGSGLNMVEGVIGLGRGPLSLISQLQPKKFSYCLPRLGEKGILSFGPRADKTLYNASNLQDIPILSNPVYPSYYYMPLKGISLDDALLPIMNSTFEIKNDGTGGMILDTGTTSTYLVQEAYRVLKQELVTRTRLPVVSFADPDLDLCFRTPAGRNAYSYIPKLKFHFEPDVVLELPKDNYLSYNSNPRAVCLAIMPSKVVSLFGSRLQQNFEVFHDLEKETVSFFPTQCSYG